jgi:hypothetical protein
MKKWVAVLAVAAVALAVWFYFTKNQTVAPAAAPEKIAAENSAVADALAKQNPNTVTIINSNFARVQMSPGNLGSASGENISPAPAGQPAPLQFTNFAPVTVLQNVSRAVRQYGEMFGGNPVGNNAEITAALTGNNPKHINFLNAEAGMRVNENGELVDAWGTPYFFHQISGAETEIHSAGPDKIMWTADDLVSR